MRKPNAFCPTKISPRKDSALRNTAFRGISIPDPTTTGSRPPHNTGRELRRFPNASRFIRRYDSTEFFTIRTVFHKIYYLYFIFAGKDIRFL